MLKGKWLTLILLLMIGYYFVNSPNEGGESKKGKVTQVVEETKNFIDQYRSQDGDEEGKAKSMTPPEAEVLVPKNLPDADAVVHSAGGGDLEDKIATVITKVLNTDKGQELLDRAFEIANQKITDKVATSRTEILNPYYGLTVKDLKNGSGPRSLCGQEAVIKYSVKSPDGGSIKEDIPLKLIVGDKTELGGVGVAIVGMKKGGYRRVLAPRVRLGKKLQDELIKNLVAIDIELLSISPKVPNSVAKYRQFDDYISDAKKSIRCGDIVSISFNIESTNGKKLFSSSSHNKPFVLKLGDTKVPYGINKAVELMKPGSKRMVIMPPEYLNNIYGNQTSFLPAGIKLPKNDVVLFEISTQVIVK
jgi:FKBP-type peptidyl-prolyl cis-trans isomerase